MSAFDYFLKIDGIRGGSVDAQHKDEFDVLGYEFDLASTIATIGGGGGPARRRSRR